MWLLFLKANWKWIVIGIAVASLVSYIKILKVEKDHYENRYKEVEAEINTLIKTSNAKEEGLNADLASITAKYKNTLHDANTLTTENARVNSENIANVKELASVKLSLAAVRLFNASKQSATKEASAAKTEPGNDGTTASVARALEEKSQTLADLLQVVNTNDANHKACISTVNEWQHFWADVEVRVDSYNNAQ